MLNSQSIDTANNVVAGFLLLGLTIIYLPQYYKIVILKSNLGFSPWFMFLGNTAAFLTLNNTLIFYINNWWNCYGVNKCIESTLGFGLIFFQWLYFLIQYYMLIKYDKSDYSQSMLQSNEDDDSSEEDKELCYNKTSKWKLMTITFWVSQFLCAIGLLITLVLLANNGWKYTNKDKFINEWSYILDIIVAIFFLLHYLPQIYETYKLKCVGSLSLISLGMMCPGTIVWSAFLAYQGRISHNSKAGNPSVWFPYILVGSMQLILLTLGIKYERQRKKDEKEIDTFFENIQNS